MSTGRIFGENDPSAKREPEHGASEPATKQAIGRLDSTGWGDKPPLMFFQPHYVRDYRRLVRSFLRNDPDAAMERAVGGDYLEMGKLQAALLRDVGLRDGARLVDVGCGSGRTAFALRDATIGYHGTDVVPELLAYARQKVGRPDWRFTLVEGLSIPEPDAAADVIAMFSVVTHLTAAEGRRYVADAARVLKPGGVLLVSFLDPTIETHRRAAAGGWFFQRKERFRGRSVKNATLTREQIAMWARDLNLAAEFFGPERVGQSYALLRK